MRILGKRSSCWSDYMPENKCIIAYIRYCCYLGSSISKHVFPGFHGPPRSEGFVPPSLTEPVRSNTSNTSNIPALAASSPDQIPPTQVSSPIQVSPSHSTHVFSSPSPLPFFKPVSQKEYAEFMESIRKAISAERRRREGRK